MFRDQLRALAGNRDRESILRSDDYYEAVAGGDGGCIVCGALEDEQCDPECEELLESMLEEME